MESIGGLALYVNGKVSTTYAVIGVGYGGRACACPPSLSLRRGGREGCQAQGGISLQRWNLLGVASFLAESG